MLLFLDTGAAVSLPDLGANITLMPDIALEDTTGDHIGDTPDGSDDDDGHGTHVTGIIGATGNNGEGGIGIAPSSSITVYDVFKNYEILEWDEVLLIYVGTGQWAFSAFTSDIIDGITAAVNNGADVINMSLGGYQDPNSEEYWDVAFKDAVDAAVAGGVVVVCSAGNDGVSDADNNPAEDNITFHSPSDYDSAISVISVDFYDTKVPSSNYGPLKDISAPGDSILSTYPISAQYPTGYVYSGGTSMASPMVAGVCALILSADPTLTVAEVKNILYTTADDLGAEGKDDYYGWGRISAQAAVLMASNLVYKIDMPDTMNLGIGRTESISRDIYPATATDVNLSWLSSDTDIATVDASGNITGIASGTVTITATNTGDKFTFQDTMEVTVSPVQVTGVTLDKSTMEIEIGSSDTLTATVEPADAANQNVTWSSDNEAVATVANGVVSSVSIGTATITVTTEDGGKTDTCDVTVTPIAVTGVTLDKASTQIVIGETDTLTATVNPPEATNKDVTWSSDNEAVATVSGGVITSVSIGTANITVTTVDGGHTDTCAVTVIAVPVDSVSLNKSTSTLYVGASELLKATVSPSNAANQSITWSTSDSGVATVDQSGKVTGVAHGTATITVTTEDGGKTDSCTYTISAFTPVTISETIRVKLSLNSPTSVPFYLDGNFSVLGGSGTALQRQQYHVDLSGSEVVLYYGTSEIARGTSITLVQHEASSGNNFLWINNQEYGPKGYLGNMVFTASGTEIEVVNHVYLDEYLYGVVPNEMSDAWPVEALKTQAIAARTYAAGNMGGGTYDVVDTSADQVYKGYDDSKVNSIAAVNGTEKTVLQWGNVLSQTYYSATNGGYTEIPYHTWGGGYALPFAIYEDPYDVANPSSPYEQIFFPTVIDGSHPITVSDNVDGTPNITNAVAYIKQRILASGTVPGVSTVNDFELTGVLELLPHTYDSDGGDEDHSRLPNYGVNDCVDFIMATGKFTVSVGAQAYTVQNIELDLRYFDAANGISTYKVFNMSALRLFVIEGDETGWSIYQRRYGHGVGLSQRGAQQRANSGHTYDEILAFYYPSTSRVTLSYAKTPLTVNTPTDNTNATVDCSDFLNVRSGPSTSDIIIGTVSRDARIEVSAAYIGGSSWHAINFGNATAYVHSDYVILDSYVPTDSVTLDQSTLDMNRGDEVTLVATVSPSNASNKNVSWVSSDTLVATVDQTGHVTAVGEGNATITVTTDVGSHTDTCTVTVTIPVTAVSLNKSTASLFTGKSETLIATVSPADATDSSVSWSTSDSGVATVAGGVVTAVAPGSATITVTTTDGSFTDTCSITVSAAPTDAIYSSVYTVDQTDSLLLGVPDEITLADMIASLDNNPNEIVVLNSEGTMISDLSTFAGTGMMVQLMIDGVVDELSVVVLGDVNGDGVIDISDYTYVRLHIFNLRILTDTYALAGDNNKDDLIDINDYTYTRLDIFNLRFIN